MKTKEEKKKSNLWFMLLVLLLISVILCISSFGIATWARYRSIVGNNVEAQIAKWSFKVNNEEEQFADINLADTIDFTHVTTDKIAPGTYGSFDLDIDGRGSEVSLDYYVDMVVAQKPTNMKFYSDSNYTQAIEIAVGNKMYLEGDLLLSENPMREIRTIYWKWDYRTSTLPSQAVLDAYSPIIPGLEALITEYDNATGAAQEEIAMKINDKIDTQEAGSQVIVNVKVKGVQINPNFSLKRVQVTSAKDDVYQAGDTVNFSMEFTENVYGDDNQTAIDGSTAPVVTVGFGGATANNPVTKVASLMNTNLKLSVGEKTATFVSASGNKINYSYTLGSTDSGAFRIASITGSVYNGNRKQINFGTVQSPTTSVPEVIGGTVTTVAPVVTPIGVVTPVGNVTPTPAATPIATALTSAQLGDYVDLGTDILDLQNVTLSDNSHPTTDWRVFNKDENGTWLMLADYFPKSKLPSTGLIANPDSNYPYSIYAHTRSDFLNGINNVGWKNLLQNTSLENADGVVVKGAIDIENWVESFNSNPEYTQLTVSDYGDERRVFGGYSDAERTTPYQMGTWTCYLDLNCASNTLYFPHIDNNSFYLLNSAYYVGDGNHKCVHVIVLDEISFGGADCNNNQWSQYERWGLRPVVYIPNTIQFNSSGSVWTLEN